MTFNSHIPTLVVLWSSTKGDNFRGLKDHQSWLNSCEHSTMYKYVVDLSDFVDTRTWYLSVWSLFTFVATQGNSLWSCGNVNDGRVYSRHTVSWLCPWQVTYHAKSTQSNDQEAVEFMLSHKKGVVHFVLEWYNIAGDAFLESPVASAFLQVSWLDQATSAGVWTFSGA